MIKSYFGYVNGKNIKNRKFIYEEFNEEFPDFDILTYDKLNTNPIFFIDKPGISLCFITNNKLKGRYRLISENLLQEMIINNIKVLVEVDKEFKNIISIYRVHQFDILGTYSIIRGSSKIGCKYISIKKLRRFLKKNYKKEETLRWND